MVVLPVMQGNTELTNSNLQMLYTKPPVTAIIGDDHKNLRHEEVRTTIKMIDKRVDTDASKRDSNDHHPYMDFMFSKPAAKTSKSPLDYGYPESFKFVQELNELPKNHKPEWALPDIQDVIDNSKFTTTGPTKGDPFQMFESVKPLDINKLLSFSPAAGPVTDSINEESLTKSKHESTEVPLRNKRPPVKRPTKKPQKIKHSPQKLSEADLSLLTRMPGGYSIKTNVTTTTPDVESEYTAGRYSVLFGETTKTFLPTPNMGQDQIATVIREIAPRTTSRISETTTVTTSTMTVTSTTPGNSTIITTTIIPNFQWANTSSNMSTIEKIPEKIIGEVNPSDLVSLTKILGENFEPKIEPAKEVTTKRPFIDDMLTNDMKNMLIALGILKLDEPTTSSTEKTTTENYLFNVFGRRNRPVTPTIDPNAYVSFKKMPINFDKARDRPPISEDMRDLLASFGLLPKTYGGFGNSILTRISRHHDVTKTDTDKTAPTINSSQTNLTSGHDSSKTPVNSTSNLGVDVLSQKMKDTLENLGLLQPLAYHHQPHRNGHVFQPTVHLELLGDEEKVQEINKAIEAIHKLSKTKDAENLSIEEIQKHLENVTSFFKKDNSTDIELVLSKSNATLNNKTIEDAKKMSHNESTSPKTNNFLIEKSTNAESQRVQIIEREKVPNTEVVTRKNRPSDKIIIEKVKTPNTDDLLPSLLNLTIIEPETVLDTDNTSEESENVHIENDSLSSVVKTLKIQEVKTETPNIASTEPISFKPIDVVEKIVEVVNKIPTVNDNTLNQDVNYLPNESAITSVKLNSTKNNHSTELNLVMNPPNPLSTEELQQLLEFNKNEVKRQQLNDNSTSSTTTRITTPSTESNSLEPTSSTELTMDENFGGNSAPISDLAESFGGGETASEEPAADDLPPPRPNGLYFYLDWNTFLNVGESDKNPVRIRFSPRAGNPRHFLNITVP